MRPPVHVFLVLLLLVLCIAACSPVPAPPPATPIALLPPATLPPPTSAAPPPSTARQVAGPTIRPSARTYDATLTSFTTEDFAGSGTCAVCHVPMKDQAGNDVSTPTHWRSTMMANASKDPIWQAKVSSEVKRIPGLKALIEEKCATCHTPMAVTQAGALGQDVALLGDGFFAETHPLYEAGRDGVSCTECHQIQEDNLGKDESFSGGYEIDTSTDAPDRDLFGPYPDPVGQLMQASSGFNPVHGPHMQTAEHCATCHNLKTPYVDARGEVLGEFPEQAPYTEWQLSTFGETNVICQDCHMPAVAGGVVLATTPPDLPQRQPFSQHHFAGGNQFMLGILSQNAADIGVTADANQLRATHARIAEQLGRAATLSIERIEQAGDTLDVQVKVSAITGHKFPTSFPSRRAWLHMTVMDKSGAVVFESGKPAADGTIAGNDADESQAKFEPHYDVITAADQVQIYEPIMADSDGDMTYTLIRAATYVKDNRLLPQGFDKGAAPEDVAVYGEAAEDENFVGGSDLVTYRVPVAGASGPFSVKLVLLYQPISYGFVVDLLADETDLTLRFGGYYETADKMPSLVATAVGKSQ